jgi:hypothetical protein
MKRLYEMGGDIINDFMPTGAVGSNGVEVRNSMLENNSQSSTDDVKNKKKKMKNFIMKKK